MRHRRPLIVVPAVLLLAGCTAAGPSRTSAPDPTASRDVGSPSGALFHQLNSTGRAESTFAATDGTLDLSVVCRGDLGLSVNLSDGSGAGFTCDGTPASALLIDTKGITSVTVVPDVSSTIWSVSVALSS